MLNREPLQNYICGVAHYGIAVPDLAEAKAQYEFLGFTAMGEIQDVPEHGVKALMMENQGQVVELLSPLIKGEPSPIDSYLETKPYKIYHTAYYVSNFDAQMAYMEANRYIAIDQPSVSASQEGKRTVFMFNRKVGIVELVER